MAVQSVAQGIPSSTPSRSLHWGDFLTINSYFVGLGYLWNSINSLSLLAIIPIMVGTLNQGTAIAVTQVTGMIIAMLVQPAAGALSDRLTSRWGRRRPYMLAGTLGDMLFLAGVAWAFAQPLTANGMKMAAGWPITDNADYWLLFAMYCGLQFTSNVAHGAAQGLIPDLVPDRQRGAASGVKALIDVLIIVVMGMTAPQIVQSGGTVAGGFQILMLVVAAVLLLFLFINWISVREVPLKPEFVPSASVKAALARSFHISGERDPDYVWLLASRLFILAGAAIVRTFSLLFIADSILAGRENATMLATGIQGNLVTVVGAVVLIIAIPAGILSDRWGRKPFNIGGALVAALGAFLFTIVKNNQLMLGPVAMSDLMAAGMVFGLGYGAFNSVNWAWATDLIPEQEAARYLGLSNLATAGGIGLSMLAGVLLDVFNRQSPGLGYTVIFVLSAVWLALGALIALKVRETRTQRA